MRDWTRTRALACVAFASSLSGCNLALGIVPLSDEGTGGASSSSSSSGAGGSPCTSDCPPDVAWSVGFGSVGADTATRVALAPDGGVLVVGSLGGDIDFGTGVASGGMFVLRLDAAGATVWSRGVPNCAPVGVAIDPSGRAIVAGNCTDAIKLGNVDEPTSGAFVAALDDTGKVVFGRVITTTTGVVEATDLAVDAAGAIAFVGGFHGSVDFHGTTGVTVSSGTGSDVFVMKIDATGADVWKAQAFGAGMATINAATAVTFAGPTQELVVAGRKQGPLDVGGEPLTGPTGSFLMRLDGSGGVVRAQTFPSAVATRIAPDAAGGVAITGVAIDSVILGTAELALNEQFLSRFDASDTSLFVLGMGVTKDTVARFDANGDLVVAGGFSGDLDLGGAHLTSEGGSDALLMKVSGADGAPIWSVRHGGPLDDGAVDLALDATRAVYVGSFSGTVTVGDRTLVAVGDRDIWITSLAL